MYSFFTFVEAKSRDDFVKIIPQSQILPQEEVMRHTNVSIFILLKLHKVCHGLDLFLKYIDWFK